MVMEIRAQNLYVKVFSLVFVKKRNNHIRLVKVPNKLVFEGWNGGELGRDWEKID